MHHCMHHWFMGLLHTIGNRGKATLALLLAVGMSLYQPAWAIDKPSIESLFQQPAFAGAQLSPQGDKVAFKLRTENKPARLVVLDLTTNQPTSVAAYDEAPIGRFHWVNNNRLVYDLDIGVLKPSDQEFNHGLFAVNADGTKYRQLAETIRYFVTDSSTEKLLPQSTHFLRTSAQQDSDYIWVRITDAYDKKKGADFRHIKRVNTLTGSAEDVDSPLHASRWVFDQKDVLRAVTTSRDLRSIIEYRDSETGVWHILSDQEMLEANIYPLFIDAQDKLYVSSNQKDGFSGVYAWDFSTNKPSSTPLAFVPGFDIEPNFIQRNGELWGLRFTIDATTTQRFNKEAQSLQQAIDKALPNTANLLSFSKHGNSPNVLIYSFSDTNPGTTSVFNRETRKFTRLGDARPDLKGKPMGSMDFVRIKARDGRTIPTYITLPPGDTKKNLPMVVLVHGGPFVRGGEWEWDSEVQFLATRGYVVLQPEFRGSTGFGSEHYTAGWKQYGQAMQDDVTDATRWAIEQGTADPKRICIMGASYGGYATMMGLIKEPDLYRCGVNWVGVSDLQLLYSVSWSDALDLHKSYSMPQLVGDPVKDAAMLAANSPLQQAARLKAPLLMAYGGKDERVPIVHGEKMRDALKAHNPNVEWVAYSDAEHGWRDLETNIDFWGKVERFLAKNIGTP